MFPKPIKKASLFLLLASFVAAPGSCTLTYAGNIKCAEAVTSPEPTACPESTEFPKTIQHVTSTPTTDDTLVTAPSAILMEASSQYWHCDL